MSAIRKAGRVISGLTVYLIGLTVTMGCMTLLVNVGWTMFGLRGEAMMAFCLPVILACVGVMIAVDHIATDIVEGR